MCVSDIANSACSVNEPKQVKWDLTNSINQTDDYIFANANIFRYSFPLALQAFESVLIHGPSVNFNNQEYEAYSLLLAISFSSSFSLIILCWICCSCPSSLKARSGADQLSSSGSRSCPKKTILLPSSSSTSLLSLHSEVTHSLLYLSICVCLSLPQIHGKPIQCPLAPTPLFCSLKASSFIIRTSDLTSAVCCVNKNKTQRFPKWTY